MNKFQLYIHHTLRFIWNSIFVITYPILATFGIIFVGFTYLFSGISRLITSFRTKSVGSGTLVSEWKSLSQTGHSLEAKVYKQMAFDLTCYHLRRIDGVPSVLENHIFGNKARLLDEGLLLEKWNTLESKDLPDFDICLYEPDLDKLTILTNIRCFDWHFIGIKNRKISLKWFDGIQGEEVSISI
jgi:hypothetical protein